MKNSFCALLFVTSSAVAAPNPIRTLIFDADQCKLAVMEFHLAGDASALEKARNSLVAARDELDHDVGAAVAAAKRAPDLRAAVKDFYAAASAYCADPSRLLESAYTTKEQALNLELKLAGM